MRPVPKPPKRSKRLDNRAKRKGAGDKAWQRRAMTKVYLNFVRPAFLHGLASGQRRKGKPALCERCFGRLATEVHHMAGRQGDALLDSEHFAGLCYECHDWCHNNPAEARAEGWMESRYSRTPQAAKMSATELLEEGEEPGTERGSADPEQG